MEGTVCRCQSCGRLFPVADRVIHFVDDEDLDEETRRERAGNTFLTSRRHTYASLIKEQATLWRDYYTRSRRRTIETLARYLGSRRRVFFLGTGRGREIEYLLQFVKLDTVYCSDLAASPLGVLRARLESHPLRVGLFTSDLQHCPVAATDIPVVIVNALHHTRDLHGALERFLKSRFQDVLFVEPMDNRLLSILARFGLAQRVEYSGVKPGRLHLHRLRALCVQYGYDARVATSWSFPRDYFEKAVSNSPSIEELFFRLLDSFSSMTSLFEFGNMAVVHLARRPEGSPPDVPGPARV
jgi:hypothetical protein